MANAPYSHESPLASTHHASQKQPDDEALETRPVEHAPGEPPDESLLESLGRAVSAPVRDAADEPGEGPHAGPSPQLPPAGGKP